MHQEDLIKTGGENVASREVDKAIYQMDEVAEVVVFEVDHPVWIEAVTAVVVHKTGATLRPEAVITFARSVLAPYKTPEYVVIADTMPKNPSGTIVKRELRPTYSPIVTTPQDRHRSADR